MTFGSLFAGIGGLDLGLERSGMKCVWQVEINEYCRQVLEKHWPSVRRWDNVETFPPKTAIANAGESGRQKPQVLQPRDRNESVADDDWQADLICGGFPCQPVSLAGRRQAKRDPRWLWPHFARIIRKLRPRFVLVENVPGLLVPGSGGLDVFSGLAEMGFDAEWATLPASAFGAPHLRERVFVVAYAGSCRRNGRSADGRSVESAKRGSQGSQKALRSEEALTHGHGAQARIFRPGPEIAALPSPCWGSDKPGVARTSHGVPNRVDRIEGIGNAVLPVVAEWIGRRIMEAQEHST